jgi:hypothetical protein
MKIINIHPQAGIRGFKQTPVGDGTTIDEVLDDISRFEISAQLCQPSS